MDKIFKNKNVRIGLLVVGVLILLLVVKHLISNNATEGFEEHGNGAGESTARAAVEGVGSNEISAGVPPGESRAPVEPACIAKEQLQAADLLPLGGANVPVGWSVGDTAGELNDKNFLNAGYHVGVNTVGQSLRNANLQLRSECPNPTVKVSPWLQTTMEPDLNRSPLDIGNGTLCSSA